MQHLTGKTPVISSEFCLERHLQGKNPFNLLEYPYFLAQRFRLTGEIPLIDVIAVLIH